MYRYTTGNQWYRLYCWWSVTFNFSDLIALYEILFRLCDQQIYLNGSVYSCCIAVPPRKLEWMSRSSSGRRCGKKSWVDIQVFLDPSFLPCLFFFYIFNMQTYFAQGVEKFGLSQVTCAILFTLFLCSTMMLQNSVGICPRSWSTCEESWVSEVTRTTFFSWTLVFYVYSLLGYLRTSVEVEVQLLAFKFIRSDHFLEHL